MLDSLAKEPILLADETIKVNKFKQFYFKEDGWCYMIYNEENLASDQKLAEIIIKTYIAAK